MKTQTIRPLAFSRSAERIASLIPFPLERLISIGLLQRSSGILAIVRSRVTPALWTIRSTPSPSSRAIASGASGS